MCSLGLPLKHRPSGIRQLENIVPGVFSPVLAKDSNTSLVEAISAQQFAARFETSIDVNFCMEMTLPALGQFSLAARPPGP